MSTGIDIPIDDLIGSFTSELWTDKKRQFYGRVFRSEMPKDSGIKIRPIYYSAAGSEGVDVLKDDRVDAQCFVDVMPVRKMNADITDAECRVLFMVNLASLYPALSRPDAIEQVTKDVKDVIMSSQFGTVQLVSGYEAFADYGWSEDALSDLAGQHLFRFDLNFTYIND